MLGAIAGDIVGSVHERANIKRTDFTLFNPNCSFTDDTVLTMAVADALVNQKPYAEKIKEYGLKYPHRGYGGMFRKWLESDDLAPYNSYGNGSAMRVSPIGFAFHRLDEVLSEAKKSAEATHNHPEGIKGAQAIAAAIFMARKNKTKEQIKEYIEKQFQYKLNKTIEQIRPQYKFDVTCQGSVPQAIQAFLDSSNVETAIRLAISLGGDADTLAAMAGGIAQAFYKKIPYEITYVVQHKLGEELWNQVVAFHTKYDIKY